MLEAAGFGVAFHGKPLLREKIPLQLNHTDLTGLPVSSGIHSRRVHHRPDDISQPVTHEKGRQ
jgi:hypothetical protein